MKDYRPRKMDDWVKSQEARVNHLELMPPGLAPTVATVVSTYVGGQVSVLLDNNTVVPIVSFPSGYQPAAGDSVIIARSKLGWHIIEHLVTKPRFMSQVPLDLQNNWCLYSDNLSLDLSQTFGEGANNFWSAPTGNSAVAGKAFATITTTGIVSVEALVTYTPGVTPVMGQIITTLPVGMRPARTQVFIGVDGNNGGSTIYVTPDGAVRYAGGAIRYYTLNNIRFRAAGYCTFVPLALASGWAISSTAIGTGDTATAHSPGYTEDVDGVVLFEGAVVATANNAANATISTVSGLPAMIGSHQVGWTENVANGFTRYGAAGGGSGVGNIVNVGVAMNSGWRVSLSQMLVVPSPLTFTFTAPQGANSWANYNASPTTGWQVLGLGKTPDGLVIARGLMNGGTVGAFMFEASKGWKARYQTMHATISNAAWARFDSNQLTPTGTRDANSGAALPSTGSNAWYSLDGLSWPAYQ